MFGGLLGLLYEQSKSLLPSILVHGFGANLAIMAILWDALSKEI
ncbi:MAG: hypothetical protein VKJ04_07155 [Vampirovibrionales bacterium]|nr:hypothetical protein [Vampirovibrionales bacterium]